MIKIICITLKALNVCLKLIYQGREVQGKTTHATYSLPTRIQSFSATNMPLQEKYTKKKKKSHSKSPTKVMLQLDWCVRKWTWRFVGLCKPHEKASYIIAFKYVLFETRPCYYNLTKKKKSLFIQVTEFNLMEMR